MCGFRQRKRMRGRGRLGDEVLQSKMWWGTRMLLLLQFKDRNPLFVPPLKYVKKNATISLKPCAICYTKLPLRTLKYSNISQRDFPLPLHPLLGETWNNIQPPFPTQMGTASGAQGFREFKPMEVHHEIAKLELGIMERVKTWWSVRVFPWKVSKWNIVKSNFLSS